MATGKVKFFNDEKGFGFIERDGDTDVFVHFTQIEGSDKLPQGADVEYDLDEGKRGPYAKGVKVHAAEMSAAS